MNATFRYSMTVVVAGLAILCAGPARAQSSYSETPAAPRIEVPDSPFENMVQAERNAMNAQAKLMQAWQDYRAAMVQVNKTRKTVQENHRTSPEVVAGQETLHNAELAFARAMEPVLADLARVPAYQTLVERRDILTQQLASDPQIVGTTRDAMAAELLEVKRQIREQEQAATEFDATAKAAQEALRAAQLEARELYAETKTDIEQDPQMVQAQSYLSGAKQNLQLARQDVNNEYVRLGMAQRNYRRAAITNAVIREPNFWYGHYWWR